MLARTEWLPERPEPEKARSDPSLLLERQLKMLTFGSGLILVMSGLLASSF